MGRASQIGGSAAAKGASSRVLLENKLYEIVEKLESDLTPAPEGLREGEVHYEKLWRIPDSSSDPKEFYKYHDTISIENL